MASNGTILISTYHTKSQFISQTGGELQPTVCLSIGDGTIYKSPKHFWTSDKSQKQATAKAAWVTFSISTCLNC